jgi:arginine exporter protein ArgO
MRVIHSIIWLVCGIIGLIIVAINFRLIMFVIGIVFLIGIGFMIATADPDNNKKSN